MGIFKRKTNSDEIESDTENEDKENRSGGEERTVKVKKIRDLNPGNKRKRKEPIRPWGRIDRLFILTLIAVTLGFSLYFALSSRGWKVPGISGLKFPNINLFGDQTIVLESNQLGKQKADKISSNFENLTNNLSGTYGLYIVDLKSGYGFGLHEDEIFQAASLIKLPVMVGMYMTEEEGGFNLDTIYKLKAGDKIKGSGSLYNKPAGYELTYRDLIRLMGKESDNTAFNICRKFLSDAKIQEIISKIGMVNTNLTENETTPADIGKFFQKLWNGELVNGKNSEELLSYLTDTIYEKHLAEGISGDIKISHKYGRETGVVNDGGIVFTDEPYVVVIMGRGVIYSQADEVFPELSKTIFDLVGR